MRDCEDAVRAYLGLPPHDGASNIVRYDPFFLNDIIGIYGRERILATIDRLKRAKPDSPSRTGV